MSLARAGISCPKPSNMSPAVKRPRYPSPSPPPPAKSTRSHSRAKAALAVSSISPGKRKSRVEKHVRVRKQTPKGAAWQRQLNESLGGRAEGADADASQWPDEAKREELSQKAVREIGTRQSSRLRRCQTGPLVTATMTTYAGGGNSDADDDSDTALTMQSPNRLSRSGRVYCVGHFLQEAHELFIQQHTSNQPTHSNHGYDTRLTRLRLSVKASGGPRAAPAVHERETALEPHARGYVARLRQEIGSGLGELRIRDSMLRRWAWEGRSASSNLWGSGEGVAQKSGGDRWMTPCVFRLTGDVLQCEYCPPSPGGTSGHELSPRRYATPDSPGPSPQVPFLADLVKRCGMPGSEAPEMTIDGSLAWLREHGAIVRESGSTRFLVDDCGLEPKIVLL